MVEPDRPQMAIRLMCFCMLVICYTRKIKYLMFFHSDNDDANALQFYRYTYSYIVTLVFHNGKTRFSVRYEMVLSA